MFEEERAEGVLPQLGGDAGAGYSHDAATPCHHYRLKTKEAEERCGCGRWRPGADISGEAAVHDDAHDLWKNDRN